ncbi:uncharacterized protein L203_100753 [Cryptococcus depauperatus CBS 7841]|uniref:NF-X1-type domain-containing protein n=1 Tax=Cryptococcus depauperatus CBS 7841 TaxID=1295531 RepID=A0AAJ8JNP4_9TREE
MGEASVAQQKLQPFMNGNGHRKNPSAELSRVQPDDGAFLLTQQNSPNSRNGYRSHPRGVSNGVQSKANKMNHRANERFSYGEKGKGKECFAGNGDQAAPSRQEESSSCASRRKDKVGSKSSWTCSPTTASTSSSMDQRLPGHPSHPMSDLPPNDTLLGSGKSRLVNNATTKSSIGHNSDLWDHRQKQTQNGMRSTPLRQNELREDGQLPINAGPADRFPSRHNQIHYPHHGRVNDDADEFAMGKPSAVNGLASASRAPHQSNRHQNHYNDPLRLTTEPSESLLRTLSDMRIPKLQQNARLDPGAASFKPGTALPASQLNVSLEVAVKEAKEVKAQEKQSSAKSRKDQKRSNKQKKHEEDTAAQLGSLTNVGRRTAFEQSTKLTSLDSRNGKILKPGKMEKPAASLARVEKRQKAVQASESDNLVTRLAKGLKGRSFIECPICFSSITPSQHIWCCLPPDRPPEPSSMTLEPDLITGSTSASSHYSACYTPFHLKCIQDWANRSLNEEHEKVMDGLKELDGVVWRCPGCQKRRKSPPGAYRCFCGRLSHPATSTSAPHSCEDSCARKRLKCDHPCPLSCHPGPCPSCNVALIAPCPSHNTPITVKCSSVTSNNATISPMCDDSPPSAIVAKMKNKWNVDGIDRKKRYVLDLMRLVVRRHGKAGIIVASLVKGYMIVVATCAMKPVIHIRSRPSPARFHRTLSPIALVVLLTCHHFLVFLDPIVSPQFQHVASDVLKHVHAVTLVRLPVIREIVLLVMKKVRMANGWDEVTCERVCKSLRNCGRHECGRLCCPLWEQAKSKNKKKRNDEHDHYVGDDLHKCHLKCNKILSCGRHSCPKEDHKGPCGKCLQASYDELICHCGRTIVYPPVACGTKINCPFPCSRPSPPCGHPKVPHQCHEEDECPPCPYLATKPCICGKEQNVKNVRCSQNRVACGQACGKENVIHVIRCAANLEPSADTLVLPSVTLQPSVLRSRTSCGASLANPKSRELEQLKCNSECAVKQRNARLADALGIKPRS